MTQSKFKVSVYGLFAVVLVLTSSLIHSAEAARWKGKSGNTNATGISMGIVNLQAGWTKCRKAADGYTYWISPFTGGCERWTTKVCKNTGGYKVSDAPRSACPK